MCLLRLYFNFFFSFLLQSTITSFIGIDHLSSYDVWWQVSQERFFFFFFAQSLFLFGLFFPLLWLSSVYCAKWISKLLFCLFNFFFFNFFQFHTIAPKSGLKSCIQSINEELNKKKLCSNLFTRQTVLGNYYLFIFTTKWNSIRWVKDKTIDSIAHILHRHHNNDWHTYRLFFFHFSFFLLLCHSLGGISLHRDFQYKTITNVHLSKDMPVIRTYTIYICICIFTVYNRLYIFMWSLCACTMVVARG